MIRACKFLFMHERTWIIFNIAGDFSISERHLLSINCSGNKIEILNCPRQLFYDFNYVLSKDARRKLQLLIIERLYEVQQICCAYFVNIIICTEKCSIATLFSLINIYFNLHTAATVQHKLSDNMAKNTEAKLETAAVKTNEANLAELNRKIVEIKRKIVLSGESFIRSLTPSTFSPATAVFCHYF